MKGYSDETAAFLMIIFLIAVVIFGNEFIEDSVLHSATLEENIENKCLSSGYYLDERNFQRDLGNDWRSYTVVARKTDAPYVCEMGNVHFNFETNLTICQKDRWVECD